MDTTKISIEPARGVTVPAGCPAVFIDALYTRTIPPPDTENGASGVPDRISETVRGALDPEFRGTLELPDVAADTTIELRFLAPRGAVRLRRIVSSRADGAAPISLDGAEIDAIAGSDPLPEPAPPVVWRSGAFVPISGQRVPFDRSGLQVAPVSVRESGWGSLGLDAIFHADLPVTTAVPWAGALWPRLSSFAWSPARVGVDGGFSFSLRGATGDAWLWWLSGPSPFVGVVLDDLAVLRLPRVSLALPPSPVVSAPEEGPGRVPTDFTEPEVATNPAVYTEDPGEFCKPFQNPERVLGERSFFVILRAQQPVISPEASFVVDPLPVVTFTPLVDGVRAIARERGGGLVPDLRPALGGDVVDDVADVAFVRHALPPRYVENVRRIPRGRTELDAAHPIQWEGDISRYQATTVARGHILELRMRWRSNGYSLGTVAKTLTLASRQTKRIQKIRWSGSEFAQRRETTQLLDRVSDAVMRDRAYDDSVQANLSEWAVGHSESSQSSGSGGLGFATAGFVIGGGGGGSNASTDANTEGGRRTSASEEQRLRDTVHRYADSLRKLDSMVVSEMTQEETATGTTEVVRNPNYAHSLTVIYYQILRHLKIDTSVAGVRECLFVPLPITPFTVPRAHRWRDCLASGLRDPQYAEALKYLKDVLTDFAGSDVPPGRRSDQPVRYLFGSLYVRLAVERPGDTADGTFDLARWAVVQPFLGQSAAGLYSRLKAIEEAQRDAVFQRQHAGPIAAKWVETLELDAGGPPLPSSFTLATRYEFNGVARVDFTVALPPGSGITREALWTIRIKATKNLPPGSIAMMGPLTFTYETNQFQRTVAADQGFKELVSVDTGAPTAGATIGTIPDEWERRDVRAEMTRAVQNLVEHLNEHVEYYHKLIWWCMDRDRLFMLIDGFYVPGTNGVSIASVVERDPIAIVGNAIVFRVSSGSFLGLGNITTPAQLYAYYVGAQPPSEPMLVSLPTDGLYAQTVMDECAALEEHFGSTDWVLKDPDPALGEIAPELLLTRRAEPQSTQPAPMPQTLINLQNAPEAPTPSGLAGVLSAVTNANAFRDLAGVAGTQANAAAALQTAAQLAQNFGNQAATLKLAQLAKDQHAAQSADGKLATVQHAVDKGLVPLEVGQQHAMKILEDLHSPSTASPGTQRDAAVTSAVNAAAASGRPFSVQHQSEDGTTSVSTEPPPEPTKGAAPAEGGEPAPADGGEPAPASDDEPLLASWDIGDGNGRAVASLSSFDSADEATPMVAFESPEHFSLGAGIQQLVDAWAEAGLVSGGAFVEDSDRRGDPLPLQEWKLFLPDRSQPTRPYGNSRDHTRTHWHWIVPNPHRDENYGFWTEGSLRGALLTGKAVTLSIGDIVLLSGDLVGSFGDFANAAKPGWRPAVNAVKGLDRAEPFAMTIARLMQFARKGLEKLKDLELLERNRSDYAQLAREVVGDNPVWAATRTVIDFLHSVRGPTGCSELLVLSRMMRKERLTPKLLERVTSWWVPDLDRTSVQNALVAARAWSQIEQNGFDSRLFQIVVSNGHYAELAFRNTDHFAPHNWAKFEASHTAALQLIDSSIQGSAVTIEHGPIPADAVALTAYGMHFMSDAFSAGHMRVPRAALGLEGSVLAKAMHDIDGKLGLTVENGFAERWRAFGDGNLQSFSDAQIALVERIRSTLTRTHREANHDATIGAMGAAMKQLHYHAQRYLDDSRAAAFRPMLDSARGSSEALLYDAAVIEGTPGDPSANRDAWIAMDIPAKIAFLRKHQPVPITSGSDWRSGQRNHLELIDVDPTGKALIEHSSGYRWSKHVAKLRKDRILLFEGEEDFAVDMSDYAHMVANVPDEAMSWVGVRETWLPEALKVLPYELP
jgi:hypothetical protein